MTMVLFFAYWLPVFIWASFIFYLSSIPGLDSGLGAWDFFLRKGAHIFEYTMFTFLFARALQRTCPTATRKKILVWAAVVGFLYAVSDEFHQSFVPGRTAALHDVMIDSIGVLVALGLRVWL